MVVAARSIVRKAQASHRALFAHRTLLLVAAVHTSTSHRSSSAMTVLSTCLGAPRDGVEGELARAIARYRQRLATAAELADAARAQTSRTWAAMRRAGIDIIPANDFSLRDHVLDTAVMLGLLPPRHRAIACPTERYVAMAFGLVDEQTGAPIAPLAAGPWFDTRHRHLVPELFLDMTARLDVTKPMGELDAARCAGIEARPVVLGPVTFLLSSRLADGAPKGASPLDLLETVLDAYAGLFTLLSDEGITWLQLDEPYLVQALDGPLRRAYEDTFRLLSGLTSRPRVMLTTYFGALRHNLTLAISSGFEALHIDLARAPDQLDEVLLRLPARMALSVGVVHGERADEPNLAAAGALVRRAIAQLGAARVWVAPSCSLLHLPAHRPDGRPEGMSGGPAPWLQKLRALRALARSQGVTLG